MYMYTTDIDGEGLPQPTTRYTMDTKQFREFYLTEPWDLSSYSTLRELAFVHIYIGGARPK